jgi:hypothetical protein
MGRFSRTRGEAENGKTRKLFVSLMAMGRGHTPVPPGHTERRKSERKLIKF